MTTEVNTMSAAVDDAIARAGRPDRKADVVSWVRSTIRELQVSALFDEDLIEDQLTATADPYIWTRPQDFRRFLVVEYPGIVDGQGNTIKPKFKRPGKGVRSGLAQNRYLYYAAQGYFVFQGTGATANMSASINVGYYAYSRKLPYYDLSVSGTVRPATFSLEDDAWSYAPEYDVDDDTRETARNLVTNWVLFRWYDAVLEGALAKLFKAYNDERSRPAYAAFQGFKQDLLKGEAASFTPAA